METGTPRQRQLEVIGLVAAGLVHDFRNVLTVVGSTLSLLDGKDMEAAQRHLLIAETGRTIDRGKILAHRLLNLAGQQDEVAQCICPLELLQSLRVFVAAASGPAIEVCYDLPATLPQVQVDRGRLELALLNLVANARDAMQGGGTLRISGTAVPSHPGGRSASYIRLAIADSGEGMNDATLLRATEPFFTTKRAASGTGIGLWLVQSFVEEMGGNFNLRSALGQGTVAEIWLPAAEPRLVLEDFIIPQL